MNDGGDLILDVRAGGLGDALVECWIAQGARLAGQEIRFNAGNNEKIISMFGFECVDMGGIPVNHTAGDVHQVELRVGGAGMKRSELWSLLLGIKTKASRPALVELSDELVEFGKQVWAGAEGRKRVMVFPFSAWKIRQWPTSHFLRCTWMLHHAGVATIAIDPVLSRVKKFPTVPSPLPYTIPQLVAIMLQADLVIGNDSGGMHLAGTLDIPGLGIIGPNDPKVVWGDYPSVVPIRTDRIGCVGCHFRADRGFSSVCDESCEALDLLSSEEVFAAAMRMLA